MKAGLGRDEDCAEKVGYSMEKKDGRSGGM